MIASMWSQFAVTLVGWTAVAIGAGVAAMLGAVFDLFVVARAETKVRAPNPVVVYYAGWLRLTLALSALMGVGMTWACWGERAVFVGLFFCVSGTGMAAWMSGVVVASRDGLLAWSIWRKERSVRWSEIERVCFRSFFGRLDFVGPSGTVGVWGRMHGLGEFVRVADAALGGRFRTEFKRAGLRIE